MKGYHNMPTETANALRDSWLYTGDIAYMDEQGFFYIVDRKKELIKPGGFQVWPRDVEEVISTHPSVLEVGVAGVPDPNSGEAVKAWVVVKPGESLTVDEVIEWSRKIWLRTRSPNKLNSWMSSPRVQSEKSFAENWSSLTKRDNFPVKIEIKARGIVFTVPRFLIGIRFCWRMNASSFF